MQQHKVAGRVYRPTVFWSIVSLHIMAVLGIVYLYIFGASFLGWCVALGYVVMTGLGVSVGYHRMLTHQSFISRFRILSYILTYFGGVAGQNAFTWVLNHRAHHSFGDTKDDPYSPRWPYAGGWKGFAWSHVRALWYSYIPPQKLRDLRTDDPYRDVILWEQKYHALIFASGFLVPFFLMGGVEYMRSDAISFGTLHAALQGLLLAGFVRIVYVFNVTWSVNSLCHIWGKTHGTRVQGMNNLLVIILGLVGEGFHWNHHADPRCAFLGRKWWHLDMGNMLISLLSYMRLISDVRLPRPTP